LEVKPEAGTGLVLQFVSNSLKYDRQVVSEAVKQNG